MKKQIACFAVAAVFVSSSAFAFGAKPSKPTTDDDLKIVQNAVGNYELVSGDCAQKIELAYEAAAKTAELKLPAVNGEMVAYLSFTNVNGPVQKRTEGQGHWEDRARLTGNRLIEETRHCQLFGCEDWSVIGALDIADDGTIYEETSRCTFKKITN